MQRTVFRSAMASSVLYLFQRRQHYVEENIMVCLLFAVVGMATAQEEERISLGQRKKIYHRWYWSYGAKRYNSETILTTSRFEKVGDEIEIPDWKV